MTATDLDTYTAGRFAGGRDYSQGRDYCPKGESDWWTAGYTDGWNAEMNQTEYFPGAGE